jgi:multimeric flavodoxin WrbA
MINGSPRASGNTTLALSKMEKVFAENGIETVTVRVGNKAVRGCVACGSCYKTGRCAFDDIVNETAPLFEECDGLVVGSPVYYASANATVIALLDRLFYSTHFDKTMKVGACVVSARRGGLSATFDELNKYFTISNMLVVSSFYWNNIHGAKAPEALEDKEGVDVMKTLANNMAYVIKCQKAAKENGIDRPDRLPASRTNFVR